MREPWQDERTGVAYHKIEHKWSVWSADSDTWHECRGGSSFLRDLQALGEEGERIELEVSSRKKIRYGIVTIEGNSDEPHADEHGVRLPGKLRATGSFTEDWDSIDDLAWTLNCEHRHSELETMIPRGASGEPGVTVYFDVTATSVDEFLLLVDMEEDRLISESKGLWDKIEGMFDVPSR